MELTKEQEKKIKAELDSIDTDKWFLDRLNEVYGEIDVCGYKHHAGNLLKEIDPTAFRCGMNDCLDGDCQDGILIEIDGEFYNYNEVETFLDENDDTSVFSKGTFIE